MSGTAAFSGRLGIILLRDPLLTALPIIRSISSPEQVWREGQEVHYGNRCIWDIKTKQKKQTNKQNNKHDIELSKFSVADHETIKTISSVCQRLEQN